MPKLPISSLASFEGARARSDPALFNLLDQALTDGRLALAEDGQKPDYIVGGQWPAHTIGSRRAVCRKCLRYIGLSPESGAMAADQYPDAVLICYPCSVKL